MQDSWEEVEAIKRQWRRRKIVHVFSTLAILYFLVTYLVLPNLPKRIEPFPKPIGETQVDQKRDRESSVPVIERGVAKTEETTSQKENGIASKNDAQTEVVMNLGATIEAGETPLAPIIDSIPKTSDNQRLERLCSELSKLLSEWADLEPAQTREATDLRNRCAFLTTGKHGLDPAAELDELNRCILSVKSKVASAKWNAFESELLRQHPSGICRGLIRLQADAKSVPTSEQIQSVLSRIASESWLREAEEILIDCSPSTSGFAEAWLPIASSCQQMRNEPETRAAVRNCRESIVRLTNPKDAVDVSVLLLQHPCFDERDAVRAISETENACGQVAEAGTRLVYLAELAGHAKRLGQHDLASRLEAIVANTAPLSKQSYYQIWLPVVLRCRTLAIEGDHQGITGVIDDAAKKSEPNSLALASCYAHLASAFASLNNKRKFENAIAQAETYLASSYLEDYPAYYHAGNLADAYRRAGYWPATVTYANSIIDPEMQAGILFRVLNQKPDQPIGQDKRRLFINFGQRTPACSAIAKFVASELREGADPLDLFQWADALPEPPLRAAAFAGFSRQELTLATPKPGIKDDLISLSVPDLNQPRTFVETAQEIAEHIEDPLEAAFAWLHIAQTWGKLRKVASYQRAVDAMDANCMRAWESVWARQKRPKKSFDGTYSRPSYDRMEDREKLTVQLILACRRQTMDMQVKLGDVNGAATTGVTLAREAGIFGDNDQLFQWNYLHLQAMTLCILDRLPEGQHLYRITSWDSSTYFDALRAVWSEDLPQLRQTAEKLKNARNPRHTARAFAELAVLEARLGNREGYRNARRTTTALISASSSCKPLGSVLATADIEVGEFALARETLSAGAVDWFGTADRSRTALCIALAEKGRIADAETLANKIPKRYPIYQCNAYNALVQAKVRQGVPVSELATQSTEDLSQTMKSIAELCGLSLAIENSR